MYFFVVSPIKHDIYTNNFNTHYFVYYGHFKKYKKMKNLIREGSREAYRRLKDCTWFRQCTFVITNEEDKEEEGEDKE